MGFKEQCVKDLNVFLNINEFADIHDIDGQQVAIVVDRDITKTRSNNRSERYDGIYASEVVVYIKDGDLPRRPVFGQVLRLDGTIFTVIDCGEEGGMLVITLGANDS